MRNFQRFVVVTGLIAGLIAGLPAQAQSQIQLQQQLKDAGKGKTPFPLHVNASLTHSVGSGTFLGGSEFNPTVSSALTLNPLLAWQGYTFLVNQSFGLEYTQSDYTTTPNQLEMSDTVLGVRYGRLRIEAANLMFVPTVSVSLPVSMQSRNAGSLGGANVGVRTIWNIPDFGSSLYGAVSTGGSLLVPALANRFANNPSKPTTDDAGNSLDTVACNPRNPQELFSYACSDGQLPSVWRWAAGVGGAWSGLDGALNVNVDLSLAQGFSAYYGPDDELTADNAVAGLAPRQSTSGNISVTWVPMSWLYVTVGASSQQALFTNNCYASDADTADECNRGLVSNEHIRFPFWDFETPRDNNSSLYLDTTVSF